MLTESIEKNDECLIGLDLENNDLVREVVLKKENLEKEIELQEKDGFEVEGINLWEIQCTHCWWIKIRFEKKKYANS